MEWFTKEEIRDIAISALVITFVLSFEPVPPLFGLENFLLFLFVTVVSFLFHELGHKFSAMKLNCKAFFKMWPQGIVISLLTVILPIRFISPGAVVISPYKFGRWGYRRSHLTENEFGIISTVGLSVNLFLALISSLFNSQIANLLYFINALLFFFNLLPVKPLDGSKILEWKPWFWVFLFIISIVLVAPVFLG
jgi:Zn-dependent protease